MNVVRINSLSNYYGAKLSFGSKKNISIPREYDYDEYNDNEVKYRTPSGKLAIALAAVVGLGAGAASARNPVKAAYDATIPQTSLVETVDTTKMSIGMKESDLRLPETPDVKHFEAEESPMYLDKEATNEPAATETTEEITTEVYRNDTPKKNTTKNTTTKAEIKTTQKATAKKLTPQERLKKDYGITIDKKIDKHNVSKRGDCYLLATLETLNACKKGRKLIKKCVTINEKSVSVKFPGINYTSEISFSKLKEAKFKGKYATGDDDILLFELAAEDAFTKIKNGKISAPEEILDSINNSKDVLYSGYMQDMMYLLTGKMSHETLNPKYDFHDWHFDDRYDYDLDAVFDLKMNNHDNVAMAICLKNVYTKGAYHSFGVVSVDKDNVYVIDPVGSKKITYSRSYLAKNIVDVEYCKF